MGKNTRFSYESRKKFVLNYTDINEKNSLPAGSGASWMKKRKEKLGTASEYCIILAMMEDTKRVPSCGWEYPTIKSASKLQKLFEVMGLVIVKSTSNFTVILMCDSVMPPKYSFRACIYKNKQ